MDEWVVDLIELYFKLYGVWVMFDVLIWICGYVVGVFCLEYIGGVCVWMVDECVFVGSLVDYMI